jgi:hypothetical protein
VATGAKREGSQGNLGKPLLATIKSSPNAMKMQRKTSTGSTGGSRRSELAMMKACTSAVITL